MLTASDRRILITRWTGKGVEEIDADIRYRRRLLERTGLAIMADSSEGHLSTPKACRRVRTLSCPSRLHETRWKACFRWHLAGSSDEEEDEEEEETALGDGGRGVGLLIR